VTLAEAPANSLPRPRPDFAGAGADAILEQLVDLLAERVASRLGDRDELVPIAAKEIGALGLELRAVQRLIAEGKLRAVDIGRRRFTTRARLLALVNELPAVGPHEQDPPADELLEATRKAAERRSRKSAKAREQVSAAA